MPAYYVLAGDSADLIGTAWSASYERALAKAARYFRRRDLTLLTAGSEVLDAMLALRVDVAPYRPTRR